LATAWAHPGLPWVAAGLGVAGLAQALQWADVAADSYPVGLALLALGYGLLAYGLWGTAFLSDGQPRQRARIWIRPLERIGLGLSAAAIISALVLGLGAITLVIDAILGRLVTTADYAPLLRPVMWVSALSGLLYLATAFVRRRRVVGYGAVALLLAAWALWWRFFVEMAAFQWYAVPAGLYLLAIGWLEWRTGSRALAHWVDRAGMLVWLGSAWWQSLPWPSLPGVAERSWPYALIMGVEALLLIWWGSARRQKRFLYAGLVGVIVDVVTQSIEPLLTVNRWIVFGIAGMLLVGLAVLIERRREKVRELSAEVRARLETWE
jgi:hypothetical protein